MFLFIFSETKFPESVSINKETNEPLKSFQVYKKQDEEGDDFDDVEEVRFLIIKNKIFSFKFTFLMHKIKLFILGGEI